MCEDRTGTGNNGKTTGGHFDFIASYEILLQVLVLVL